MLDFAQGIQWALLPVITRTSFRFPGSPFFNVRVTSPSALSQVKVNGSPSTMSKLLFVRIGFARTAAAKATTVERRNFMVKMIIGARIGKRLEDGINIIYSS